MLTGLLAGVWMVASLAQEPAGPAASSAPAPVEAPAPRMSFDVFSERAVWRTLLVPGNPLVFSDVQVAPEPGGLVLACEPSGAVWIRDEGRWSLALEPIPGAVGLSDNPVGLNQFTIDDIVSQSDVGRIEVDLSGGVDVAYDEIEDELGMMVDDTEDDHVPPLPCSAYLLDGGRLGVARLDGFYVSDDEGLRWRRVALPGHVTSAIDDPRGGTLLGREGDGRALARLAADGSAEPVSSTLDRYEVWSLATDGERVAAATSGGVYATADGTTWELVVGAPEGHAVFASALHPGQLWVATETSVVRGPMGGGTFEAPLGETPQAVRRVAFGPRGLLFAAGADGAWAMRLGTISWRRIGAGLMRPGAGGVAVRPDLVVLAGEDGLRRLAVEDAEDRDPRGDAWIPLDLLVDASARRVGIASTRERLGNARNALRYLLPQVSAGATWRRADQLESRIDEGLFPGVQGALTLDLQLTWVPPKRQSTIEAILADGDGDDFIADSQRYGRHLEQDAQVQAQEAFALVARLYRDRQELRRELGLRPPGRTLLDETHLALRVLEIEAMLDAVTDGAVSQYTSARKLEEEPR